MLPWQQPVIFLPYNIKLNEKKKIIPWAVFLNQLYREKKSFTYILKLPIEMQEPRLSSNPYYIQYEVLSLLL